MAESSNGLEEVLRQEKVVKRRKKNGLVKGSPSGVTLPLRKKDKVNRTMGEPNVCAGKMRCGKRA